MHLCMDLCMYNILRHVRMKNTHVHAYALTHMHTCVIACAHVYVRMYTCRCMYMYSIMHDAYIYVCVYVCTFLCICAFMYVLCMHYACL